MAASGRALFEN